MTEQDMLRERIVEHLSWRRWYRGTCRAMFGHGWDDLAAENDADLRHYVRRLRRLRAAR